MGFRRGRFPLIFRLLPVFLPSLFLPRCGPNPFLPPAPAPRRSVVGACVAAGRPARTPSAGVARAAPGGGQARRGGGVGAVVVGLVAGAERGDGHGGAGAGVGWVWGWVWVVC